jgi:hypothetical protein
MRTTPFLLLVGGLVASATSQAQTEAGGPPSAAELFRQGRAAMVARDYATACPKLEASVRLEAHVGNLISLAECEEATARLAAARGHWQQAADLARGLGDQRESFAREKLAILDPRVPRLTIRRAPGSPETMTVARDDVALGPGSFDIPLPVEVGTHVVVTRAEGFEPTRIEVTFAERDAKIIDVEPGRALSPPVPEPHEVVLPVTPTGPRARIQRPVAIGFAGAGVIAAGVGTGFGIAALHGNSLPPTDTARNTARTDGDVSTGMFIAAGALVGTAAVLWFTAPKALGRRAGFQIVPHQGGGEWGVRLVGEY